VFNYLWQQNRLQLVLECFFARHDPTTQNENCHITWRWPSCAVVNNRLPQAFKYLVNGRIKICIVKCWTTQLQHMHQQYLEYYVTVQSINLIKTQSSISIIIIIISGFGIYGAAVVPDSGVGNTWQRLTLVLHEFLSNGLTPSRLHIVISILTHADHVFLGLPRSLVPGSPNRVMELMHEVARCTCLYHLRRRVRRTAVISSRSSFGW